jgi:outer membrane receptor protein involved in Fe transport
MRTPSRLVFSAVFLFATLLFFSSTTSAQSTASIHGTVTDPSGASVANVDVTLLNNVGVLASTRSMLGGAYQFSGLTNGTYRVVANAPGFTTLSSDIALAADQNATLDLQLKISAAQQQVVVSASLGGSLAPESGSSVTVISKDEIQNQGVTALSDAMRDVPGVEINRTGEMGAVTSAFIRGGSSNYNLVMLDGIPLNDFGGAFDLSTLPAQGIDHVEVLRGPQSALYGSNAVSGVIDVVTASGDGSPRFSFEGEGGSYDSYLLNAGGSGRTGNLGWAFSLGRYSTQGPVINDTFWNQTSFLSLNYSRSERRQFVFHFFGDSSAALNPGPYGSDPDGLYPGLGNDTSQQKRELFGYQGGYTEQISHRVRQVSSVSVSTDRYSFPSPFGNSFTNNLNVAANTRSEIAVSDSDTLVAGLEYDRQSYKDTYVTNAADEPFALPRNSFAFFAENRLSLASRWFLSTGLRVDNIRTGQLAADELGAGRPTIPAASITKVDPRVSVAYLAHNPTDTSSLGATRIHSSFGTGIRPPDGFELGFTNNPELKPEQSISVDAGVEQHFFSDRVSLDVTYFYNRFKDQIVTLGNAFSGPDSFDSENIANSRAYGIETSLRLQPIRSLQITAEYTWLNAAYLALDGFNSVQPPFVVGDPFIRQPRSSAGYNITWTYRRLTLNTNASVRGVVLDLEPNDGTFACELDLPCLFRNPRYVDANAGFTFKLPLGAELFGQLNNFADQKYEESLGFPALRLNFMAGLRLNLSGGPRPVTILQ